MPLFPGYVFTNLSTNQRALALATPGVTGIVGFGGKAEPIPDLEVESLMCVANSGLLMQPWALMKAGDEVVIDDGPLRGLRGKLLKDADRHQLIVGVELLQRAVAVTLTPDQAWPVRSVNEIYERANASSLRASCAKAS